MRTGFGVSCAALAAGLLASSAAFAQQHAAPPPLPYKVLKELKKDPAKFQEFLRAHPAPAQQAQPGAEPTAEPTATPQWQAFPQAPGGTPLSNPLQMTDGSIIAHASCTGQWYRLAPDINGNYFNGVWSPLPLMPGTYSPRFFGSAVLSDGRIIIEGGEYNGSSCADVESNLGAIYSPATKTWTAVPAPSGWTEIGDAESIMLPNNTYLLSSAASSNLAIFNPSSLTWSSFLPPGKSDGNNEESWTLLPNGNFLAVEAYTLGGCSDGSAMYESASKAWVSAGTTVHQLNSCSGSVQNFESPTQLYLPSGKVLAFSNSASLPSQNLPTYTAIYDYASKTWSAGPLMPKILGVYSTMADAPATILPDGTAMVAVGPGEWAKSNSYPPNTHVLRLNGSTWTLLPNLPNFSALSSYQVNMLVLPTGDILAVETDFSDNAVFPAASAYPAKPAYAPIVGLVPANLTPGNTYTLSGNQLSGLTQGAVYGDDAQADTNFPLVRIVNNATKHVFYATTTNFSRNITPNFASSVSFKVAAATEAGASTLYVVANGIASSGSPITVK